jgi:hypothetical protein
MLKQNELEIRLLEPADVPALLTIIADSRAEYGMADRGVDLLEPADKALFETYKRQRSLYFVALSGGEVVGGAGVAPLKGSDPLTAATWRRSNRCSRRCSSTAGMGSRISRGPWEKRGIGTTIAG